MSGFVCIQVDMKNEQAACVLEKAKKFVNVWSHRAMDLEGRCRKKNKSRLSTPFDFALWTLTSHNAAERRGYPAAFKQKKKHKNSLARQIKLNAFNVKLNGEISEMVHMNGVFCRTMAIDVNERPFPFSSHVRVLLLVQLFGFEYLSYLFYWVLLGYNQTIC